MIGHRGTTGGPLPKQPVLCANNSEMRGCSPGPQETTTTLALFERTSARLRLAACGLQPSRLRSPHTRSRRRQLALGRSRRTLIGFRRPAEPVARLRLEMGRPGTTWDRGGLAAGAS